MTKRKKRLFVIQIALLLLAIIIIYLTYYNKEKSESIIKIEDQQKILTQKIEDNGNTNEPIKNKFTDIEYSGLDLNGNRYILKSKKAEFEVEKPELIFMQIVEATFYFKDGTILYVNSDEGIYNNKSLDMIFKRM